MRQSYINREYDYAIRICAFLAGYDEPAPIPVSHIADALFITRPFATKIINQLRLNGVTASKQGKFGGVFLNVDAQKLSIYDVLEAMDFSGSLNECVNIPTTCPFSGFCNIHTYFSEQQEQLMQNFKDKKISDFAFNEDDLKKI